MLVKIYNSYQSVRDTGGELNVPQRESMQQICDCIPTQVVGGKQTQSESNKMLLHQHAACYDAVMTRMIYTKAVEIAQNLKPPSIA